MAQDSRGYQEIVQISHENAFSTITTYTDTTPSAEVLINSASGSLIYISDLSFRGATVTNFTVLDNTTTTKFQDYATTGAWSHHHFGTDLVFSTSGAVHFTADGTSCSVFISGYKI